MTRREILLRVAWHYLGTPYVWAGDGPRGFDCSGYAIECLKSAGAFPRRGDATADSLMRRYVIVSQPKPADLVFWLDQNGVARHMGVVTESTETYLGAEGGGSWADDPHVALVRGAYIQARPIKSRGHIGNRVYRDPFAQHSTREI